MATGCFLDVWLNRMHYTGKGEFLKSLPWTLDSKCYNGLIKVFAQQCLFELRLFAASLIKMNSYTLEPRLLWNISPLKNNNSKGTFTQESAANCCEAWNQNLETFEKHSTKLKRVISYGGLSLENPEYWENKKEAFAFLFVGRNLTFYGWNVELKNCPNIKPVKGDDFH